MSEKDCFKCEKFLNCEKVEAEDSYEKDLEDLYRQTHNIDSLDEETYPDYLVWKNKAEMILQHKGDIDEIVKEVVYINELVKQDEIASILEVVEDFKKVKAVQ